MSRQRISRSHISHCFTNKKALSPFYFLVSTDSVSGSPSATTVVNILRFPQELQNAIYQQCNPSTLYQLMQASSSIRSEARKVFWAHTEPWYHCEAAWLSNFHGSPGLASHCPVFASQVQQVSVYFTLSDGPFRHPLDTRYLAPGQLAATHAELSEHIKTFWDSFQSSFPAAKRVLLTTRRPHEDYLLLSHYNPLIEGAPLHLRVFLSAPTDTNRTVRPRETLWHVSKSTSTHELDWQIISQDCQEHIVRMPVKKTTGLAASLLHYEERSQCLRLEFYGIREYLLKLYSEYHFRGAISKPVTCPQKSCDYIFTHKDQWSLHADVSRHYISMDGSYLQFGLPDSVFKEVRYMDAALKAHSKDLTHHMNMYMETLGKNGSNQWQQHRNQLLRQLETDPLFKQRFVPLTQLPMIYRFDTWRETYGEE